MSSEILYYLWKTRKSISTEGKGEKGQKDLTKRKVRNMTCAAHRALISLKGLSLSCVLGFAALPQKQRSTEQNIHILPLATGQSSSPQPLPKAGDSCKAVRQQLMTKGQMSGRLMNSDDQSLRYTTLIHITG